MTSIIPNNSLRSGEPENNGNTGCIGGTSGEGGGCTGAAGRSGSEGGVGDGGGGGGGGGGGRGGGGGGYDGVVIPMLRDELTFEGRQALRLEEMEKKVEEELRKKTKEWDRNVQQMKEEFLELFPCDRKWNSDETLNDPLIVRRRGSTDVLDVNRMKALILEYPDSGQRWKLRFSVSGFDLKNVFVETDSERIIVRASRREETEEGVTFWRDYARKIERPKEVEATKLRALMTTDGILIIEAQLPPSSLNLRQRTTMSRSSSRSSNHCASSSNYSLRSKSSPSRSPGPGNGSGGGGGGGGGGLPVSPLARERFGVPVLRDDNGRRKVNVFVDIGKTFSPKEITIQIIRENRIQVKARHEERTSERLSKNKFSKDYELPEKIETYSLRAGITNDGKLMIAALIKGQGAGLSKVTAGELMTDDLNNTAENQPCNVLDLSTFPPTTPALIAASSSWQG